MGIFFYPGLSGKVFCLPPAIYKFICLSWYHVQRRGAYLAHRSRHQRCAAAGRSTLAASGIGEGRGFARCGGNVVTPLSGPRHGRASSRGVAGPPEPVELGGGGSGIIFCNRQARYLGRSRTTTTHLANLEKQGGTLEAGPGDGVKGRVHVSMYVLPRKVRTTVKSSLI